MKRLSILIILMLLTTMILISCESIPYIGPALQYALVAKESKKERERREEANKALQEEEPEKSKKESTEEEIKVTQQQEEEIKQMHEDWEKTKKIDTPSAYKEFIAKYPEKKFEVMRYIYNKVKEEDTIEAYQYFIDNYPDSVYVQDAKNAIERLTVYFWDDLARANNSSQISAFAELYAKYPNRKGIIIYHAWKKAEEIDSIEAYKVFLKYFPDTKYTSEAEFNIDSINWQTALKQNDIKSYQNFLINQYGDFYTDIAEMQIKILKTIGPDISKQSIRFNKDSYRKAMLEQYNTDTIFLLFGEVNQILIYDENLKEYYDIFIKEYYSGQIVSVRTSKKEVLEGDTVQVYARYRGTSKYENLFGEIEEMPFFELLYIFPINASYLYYLTY